MAQKESDRGQSTVHSVKVIRSVDEREDYPGQTLITRDHDVIRRWAEERKADPAVVPGAPYLLRFDFPGYDADLDHVSWDDWFRIFDERDLEMIYQEHLRNGRPSNFFQFEYAEERSPER